MLIKQVNGLRVAIIGLITDETPDIVTPTGNDGILFAPPLYSLAAIVRSVRPHVDLVILLSHLGYEEDRRLANEVDGVDLIVGGHSHDLIEPEKAGRTLIVQANRYGTHVGYLDLMVDTDHGGITEFDGRLIPAADLPPPEPDVNKAVNDWEAKVEATVDVVIGTADRELTDEALLPLIESILARQAGTRFGLYNLGGIRDSIRPGKVTARHIWNIEPFGNTLVTVTTDGATLRAIVAMDGATHEGVGRIDDGATYTFATSSFVAALAKRRSPETVSVSDKGVLVRDLLIDYIRQNGLE